jgi:signal transduction histidine kinase
MIKDTGIGIPEKELANIFDRFRKGVHSNEEGYGLGFILLRRLPGITGFRLMYNLKISKGTVFSVVFPEQFLAPGRSCSE